MAEHRPSADAFSTFLTRTAPPESTGTGRSVTSDLLPRAGAIMDLLSDGHAHSVSELQSSLPFGLLELAETLRLLQANGMVTVRTQRTESGTEELVELSEPKAK